MQYTKDEINAYNGINPLNKVMPSQYAKMNNAQNKARIEINTPARTQIYTEVLYNHMQYFDDRKAEGSSETDGWTER